MGAGTGGGIEVWRGSVNAWECDEMGHMNARFYVVRCMEGLAVLFAFAGLPGLFAARAPSTVRVDEMHMRFHGEAPAARPLNLAAGFSRIGESDGDMVAVLRHSFSGTVAATFRLSLKHVAADGAPAPWPAGFAARAPAMTVPPEAQPRSVRTGAIAGAELVGGLADRQRVALGALGAGDCDAAGAMLPQKFLGAVSDGVRELIMPLRDIVVRHAAQPPRRFGGAVLEARAVFFHQPRVGDCFEIRSAFREAGTRTLSLEHWLADPISGRRLAWMESMAVVFDLDRRAIVPINEEARVELQPLMLA